MYFNKILIANRGEIAVRILRACRELGIRSVAVFSEVDRNALHVLLADEAYCIGPPDDSYLNIGKIITTTQKAGAEAVHPGYGFLAENADFAEACESAGIKFIGPTSRVIRLMGEKVAARREMAKVGVPVVPGLQQSVSDLEAALAAAQEIGYPVMVKATAGGGGKGIRIVSSPDGLRGALETATSEASSSFGKGGVYIEKCLESPRHIEVQILADHHGHVVHLGERECSIQRRHQKLIEETPSPALEPTLRERIWSAALRAATHIGYTNAGTVEFLLDQQQDFHFLEMNTRLQVEHPVTEMVTGVDIVKEQIAIAAGEPLSFRQADIHPRGTAIEFRIYAEDPDRGFIPCPGTVRKLIVPGGDKLRWESYVTEGMEVPMWYDPLLAKLVVWGKDRGEALGRARQAFRELRITGIKTTAMLFEQVLSDPEFLSGKFDTGFIQKAARRSAPAELGVIAAIVAAMLQEKQRFKANSKPRASEGRPSAEMWQLSGRLGMLRNRL